MELTTPAVGAAHGVASRILAGPRYLAGRLRRHFGRDLYQFVAAESSVSVLERNESAPSVRTPLSIDWDTAEFSAVVALVDATLVDDPDWVGYVRDIARTAHAKGLPEMFFPVNDGRSCAGLAGRAAGAAGSALEPLGPTPYCSDCPPHDGPHAIWRRFGFSPVTRSTTVTASGWAAAFDSFFDVQDIRPECRSETSCCTRLQMAAVGRAGRAAGGVGGLPLAVKSDTLPWCGRCWRAQRAGPPTVEAPCRTRTGPNLQLATVPEGFKRHQRLDGATCFRHARACADATYRHRGELAE